MPSPSGYLSDFSYVIHDRQSFRVTVDHDVDNPPWLPGQAGAYTFVWETGPTAAGPWVAAPLTDFGVGCTPQPDNETTLTTATNTLVRIGDPTPGTGTTADTDYFVRVTLLDPTDVQVDQWVLDTPAHTDPYPEFVCSSPNITETSATAFLGQTDGSVNQSPPCNQDTIVWELATTPGGPYTPTAPEDAVSSPDHAFTGLTPGTTYYWRARLSEQPQSGGEYLVTPECSFTTEEAAVTTPPFQPQPCDAGAGADAVDVEQTILCDTLADGTIAGTAMAVWEYDATGNPTGPPTFVDPATGNPYVAQGTLMPCPGETGCLEPVAFHRTTTSTGPVDHPGRQYDITLPINPGFAVQSLQVDQVTSAANIVWDVADPDGEQFRQDLTAFIEGRVPAAATVTMTNPNAGQTICGTAAPMQIHIECLRLDQSPPDLIELVYNGGQDMIINPAYNETPPLNPPVSQGNYGFRLLAREDDPGPFPGNPPAERANCTNVANRGWETNDLGRTFEIWGQDIVNGSNVTPTPRGTPVQEITSDGPPPGGISTIWQTFQAPASANFVIRVVHGARDPGEIHRITLDNGDTDDAQNGDLIDDTTTNVGVVTNSPGGPGPWTQFNQTIPLTAGNTYTLALSTTETSPDGNARGGLFTDMRAYIDRPDLRATATTDDDTCVVTVDETTTVCQDELWSPVCESGTIESWQNAETGAVLSNAAFWGQAPAPVPGACPATASSGGGGSVAANLVHTYPVCATVGGIRTNLQRVVITDPSGGVLADSFIGTDGGPVATPSSYTIGSCTDTAFVNDEVLCDDNGPFLRKYVQSLDATNQPQINTTRDFTLGGAAYTPVGTVGACGPTDCSNTTTLLVCDLPTGDPDGTPTVTDSGQQFIADTANADFILRPGGGGALWTGGVINFGPDAGGGPGITQVHRFVSATLQAVPPSCTDGTVDVSLSVQVLNQGPGAGCSGAGRFRLYRVSDGAVLASGSPLFGTPAGATVNLTINATIAAAELTAGNVAVWLDVETWQTGTCAPPDSKTWQASNFTAAYSYGTEGCETQFLRTVVTDCETGETLATVDTTVDGAPYVVTGEVGQCTAASGSGDPCPCVSAEDIGQAVADHSCGTASSIGTVCYTPPVAVQTLQDDWTGATSVVGGGSRVWTNSNFANQGITVTETVTPDTGAALLGAGVRNTAANPATQHTVIDLGAPRTNVTVRMDFFGSAQGERLRNITPAYGAVSGNGTGVLANTGVDGGPAADGTIFLNFPGPVQTISWDYAPTGSGLSGQSFISFNTGNASNSAPAAVLRDCETGTTTFIDLATGTVLDPAAISIVDCPGDEAATAIDQQDVETLILCDATPTRFLRAIKYDAETGAVLSVVNTALDGTTPFAPVGAVGICSTPVATDFDFLSTVLCDANGTQFIQRLTFNSSTGAVTATTNTTLTGGAFAPVAPVSLCSNCCPQVIGEGCTNTGSGRYTAVRATNGTVTLIDSVSGATILAANIIPCPDDDTVRTLTAQHRLVGDADAPWTPGADVTGTLTSVTYVVLSGTATVVDQNGTAAAGLPAGLSATWNAEDDNTLQGPTSIDAVGGQVYVHWTQR
ncbi:hypothetical protein ACKI16_29430 [Streptomyces scabiei]|uniref:hypothetical protein n=1 Tax=Streptomyces scabiei TaxID=1930 RepID=UPI0038F5FEC2